MAVRIIDTHTESAGTAIVEIIPAVGDGIATLDRIVYTNGATAHTMTVMRPVGSTVTTATALSGQAVIQVSKQDMIKTAAGADETVAANDYLVWADENGVFHQDTVASLTNNAITMNNNLTADIADGATIWAMGELARGTHSVFTLAASSTNLEILGPIRAGYKAHTSGGFQERSGAGDPLLISIDNATNAGTIVYGNASWSSSDDFNV